MVVTHPAPCNARAQPLHQPSHPNKCMSRRPFLSGATSPRFTGKTFSHFAAASPTPGPSRAARASASASSFSPAAPTPTPPPTPPSQPAPPPETKYPVTLEALPVTRNVTLLRASCTARLPEIQFSQRAGTTTNCYLIKGANGAAEVLIDVPSKAYDYDIATWLEELDVLRTLRTVIITRFNPERVPPLKSLLKAAKGPLRILTSNPALQLLKERAENDPELASLLFGDAANTEAASGNDPIELVAVNRGTEEKLSDGKTLRFVPIPTPRWPDLAAVYLPEDRLLFSSSFFAAHEAPKEGGQRGAWDDGGWEAHGEAWRYYYDCMLAPAAKQAAVALDRLRINAATAPADASSGPLAAIAGPVRSLFKFVEEMTLGADDGAPEPLAVAALCPIHGPIVRSSLTELVGRYVDWTAAQVRAASAASVAVMYASAYGNTAALAQAISRGVTKAGIGVETLNLEIVGVDEVEASLQRCAGFVLGAPTLGGHLPTQVQTALGAIIRTAEAKALPCGVFGSFGWSGEAVDIMEGRLRDGGFQFAFPAIRCKFKPTERTLQECEESGTDLAQAIKRAAKKREKAAAEKLAVAETTPPAAQALGRVLGSLCVLTSRDGEATGAMLASWVSQASFDPPGLTIAVKKDRAIEALLPTGGRFVLNVLAEGKERGIAKQLLKPFKPGEDRFAGLETKESEATGGVILPEAASYLECTVLQRMEAGDHWIVYATVQDGGLLDENALSAVHYRKSGVTY